MLKKLVYSAPVLAAASSFAAGSGAATGWTPSDSDVTAATSTLSTWGGMIIAGIGGVVAVAAGLRLLVKGINRAVGK